ncbi:MAG: hypothetical protein IT384_05975 [Deltaproteobacteria bacterium]|nr:hypothetical protein [Deltaproteobacteria bacterium]
MSDEASVKRIRIKTKAHDRLGLAHAFKSHLSPRGVFIKTKSMLPQGTKVVLELLYSSGERALYGQGVVAWSRTDGPGGSAGLNIELEWDAPSRALVDQVVAMPSLARPPKSIGGARPAPVPRRTPPAGSVPPVATPPGVMVPPLPSFAREALASPAGSVPPAEQPDPSSEKPTEISEVAPSLRPISELDLGEESQAGILVAMDSMPPPAAATAQAPGAPPDVEAKLEEEFRARSEQPSLVPSDLPPPAESVAPVASEPAAEGAVAAEAETAVSPAKPGLWSRLKRVFGGS